MKLVFPLMLAPLMLGLPALAAASMSAPTDSPIQQLSDDPSLARIGATTIVNRLRITPVEVLGDSRCPEMVFCVHPGIFTLAVRIGNPVSGKIIYLEWGRPKRIHGQYLTLIEVKPGRDQTEIIPPEAYRFRFRYAAIKR